MRILSIETSCDETAIALVDIEERDGTTKVSILGNTLISQAKIHEEFGGVFPNLARREHQKNLVPVLRQTLSEANLLKPTPTQNHSHILENIRIVLERESELLVEFLKHVPTIKNPEIDLIAVTNGPGLEPALWVGINFARALGTLWNIPVVPCNHMEGHVLVAMLRKDNEMNDKEYILCKAQYPSIALLISGGHTELVLMEKANSYKVVGETKDDAVGECFDKVARTLGLPYPGGPEISRLAEKARIKKIAPPEKLPRPMLNTNDLDFSFSGLKTAVLYLVKRIGTLNEEIIAGIARETEDAITEVLSKKTKKAVEKYGARTIIIGGGVIANNNIRNEFGKTAMKLGVSLLFPEVSYSTDNALMIALAGYVNSKNSQSPNVVIKANGNLSIDN